jgi:hypothetical protein
MTNFRTLTAALASTAVILAAAGCSFSDSSRSSAGSSESSSTSSGSLSASSSPSSSTDKAKASFRDDVANLTYSVAGSGLTAAAFSNSLARTAQKFNITNWAGEKATFTGIGKGLRRAAIPKSTIPTQPFLKNVLASNKDALKLIQEGYGN